MATFSPPTDLTYPALGPDIEDPVARKLLRHGSGGPRGRVVVLYDNNTAVMSGAYPPATYNANGTIQTLAEDRVSAVFVGGNTYTVTATQAATLTAAGYTVT